MAKTYDPRVAIYKSAFPKLVKGTKNAYTNMFGSSSVPGTKTTGGAGSAGGSAASGGLNIPTALAGGSNVQGENTLAGALKVGAYTIPRTYVKGSGMTYMYGDPEAYYADKKKESAAPVAPNVKEFAGSEKELAYGESGFKSTYTGGAGGTGGTGGEKVTNDTGTGTFLNEEAIQKIYQNSIDLAKSDHENAIYQAELERRRSEISARANARLQSDTYGRRAEALADTGMQGSGYSDYIGASANAAAQGAVQDASAIYAQAVRSANYNKTLAKNSAEEIYASQLASLEAQKKADEASANTEAKTNYNTVYSLIKDGTIKTEDELKAFAGKNGITDEATIKELGSLLTSTQANITTSNSAVISEGISAGSYTSEDAVRNAAATAGLSAEDTEKAVQEYWRSTGDEVVKIIKQYGLTGISGADDTIETDSGEAFFLSSEFENIKNGKYSAEQVNQIKEAISDNVMSKLSAVVQAYASDDYKGKKEINNLLANGLLNDEAAGNVRACIVLGKGEIRDTEPFMVNKAIGEEAYVIYPKFSTVKGIMCKEVADKTTVEWLSSFIEAYQIEGAFMIGDDYFYEKNGKVYAQKDSATLSDIQSNLNFKQQNTTLKGY